MEFIIFLFQTFFRDFAAKSKFKTLQKVKNLRDTNFIYDIDYFERLFPEFLKLLINDLSNLIKANCKLEMQIS